MSLRMINFLASFLLLQWAATLVVSGPTPTPDSPHTVFLSKRQEDVKLRFVKDSGVCETTPGVGQMSGYIDIGTNMSMASSKSFGVRINFNFE
ncbi:hypothetical protein ONZ45_g16398 [Pleurotus djamor]|nr:hypothetical protein ONZ45_g16398 [Pleurotus djamor]